MCIYKDKIHLVGKRNKKGSFFHFAVVSGVLPAPDLSGQSSIMGAF